VSYDKGIYAVDSREARQGAKSGRLMNATPLGACKPRA
jgi:hypothetical protein